MRVDFLAEALHEQVYIVVFKARRRHAAVLFPADLGLGGVLGDRIARKQYARAAVRVHEDRLFILPGRGHDVFLQVAHLPPGEAQRSGLVEQAQYPRLLPGQKSGRGQYLDLRRQLEPAAQAVPQRVQIASIIFRQVQRAPKLLVHLFAVLAF